MTPEKDPISHKAKRRENFVNIFTKLGSAPLDSELSNKNNEAGSNFSKVTKNDVVHIQKVITYPY